MASTFAEHVKIAFDKPHRLGPYWAVWHDRNKDKEFFMALQPSVMKIMDGGSSHYKWAYDALPGTLIVARDWGLDDKHGSQWAACLADPVGTAKRHIAEWKVLIEHNGIDKNRTAFMGVNEPNVWVPGGIEATVAYTVALCDEGAKNDMHMLALNLSVGWPANSDTATVKDTPVNWKPYAPVLAAIKRGNHILGLHEYWNFGGPAKGWGWLAGRFTQCDWDVPIIIGEFAFSRAVNNSQSVPTKEQGWQANGIKPEEYADMLIDYHNRIVKDGRILGTCVYLCDFQNEEWWSKDVEPAYPAILARKSQLQKPAAYKPPPPVITPPIVVPPVTPPATTLTGKVGKVAPNDGVSYVYGQAPNDATVYFAWRGNPAIDGIKVGPHEGYTDWKPGYFNIPLYSKGKTPCVGDWDVWAVSSGKTSARVQFHTDGAGGKSNQVEVNFALTTVPVIPPVTPPVVEPPVVVPAASPLMRLHPLDSAFVTQYFGVNGADYAVYNMRGHNGIDYRAAIGTPVKATADGVVAYVDNDVNYGLYVRIWHKAIGCHTFYAHLSKANVKAGDVIKQGQVIALSGASGVNGNTGKPNPAHLHYEIRLCNAAGAYVATEGMKRGQVDPFGFVPGLERGAAVAGGGGSKVYFPIYPNVTAEFKRALAFVLRWEGGWSDDPNDPGGATMRGITLGTYTAWRKAHGQPVPTKDDLSDITDAEVQDIYWANYWIASGADKLAWPLQLAHFDAAVNAGVGQATLFKAASTTFAEYMGARLEFYTKLKTWATFGAGWTRRCADLLKEAD